MSDNSIQLNNLINIWQDEVGSLNQAIIMRDYNNFKHSLRSVKNIFKKITVNNDDLSPEKIDDELRKKLQNVYNQWLAIKDNLPIWRSEIEQKIQGRSKAKKLNKSYSGIINKSGNNLHLRIEGQNHG